MGDHYEIGRIIPNERIRRILKLPSQDFTVYEYESGERRIVKNK